MTKIIKLQSLQDGDRFIIPTLSTIMRKMSVVRIGTGSALIKGERRDEQDKSKEGADGGWRAFEYCVSLSTPVIYLGAGEVEAINQTNKPMNEENTSVIETPQLPVVESPKVEKVAKVKGTGRRGRPSKSVMVALPEANVDFTIGDIATMNGIEKYDVINFLRKKERDGCPIVMREVGSRKTGSKGKPSKVYRLA